MIELKGVSAGYRTPTGFVTALDDVTLTIGDEEILGIAGESGCGKSTLIRVLYGELAGPVELAGGNIHSRFTDPRSGQTQTVETGRMRDHWWDLITYVPQGSMSVLNPVMRIEGQFIDGLPRRRHGPGLRREIVAFLSEFDLDANVLRAYPHELSGGMRQRVLVAMAAFVHPRLILADEPTTALDVVVQKRILLSLYAVQKKQRNSLVIVSHDMGVHYQITDRLAIVYAGKVVEIGPTDAVFGRPQHPYTRGLVEAIPRIGDATMRLGIDGRPPDLAAPPMGCRFRERCPEAQEICARVSPALEEKAPGQSAACHMR